MKEIRAYIQPFMLPKLTQALLEIQGFPGMSGREFASLFTKANQISFHKVINRFEFEYVD